MSIATLPISDTNFDKGVYFIKKAHPHHELKPSFIEKVKTIAGAAIAFFGLAFLAIAAVAFIGHSIGLLAMSSMNLEMAFMIGLVSTVAGFNLATKTNQPAELYLGPLSLTV